MLIIWVQELEFFLPIQTCGMELPRKVMVWRWSWTDAAHITRKGGGGVRCGEMVVSGAMYGPAKPCHLHDGRSVFDV